MPPLEEQPSNDNVLASAPANESIPPANESSAPANNSLASGVTRTNNNDEAIEDNQYNQFNDMDFKTEQMNDIDLQQIRDWISANYSPTRRELADKPLRLKRLASIIYKTEIHDGTLYVKKQDEETEVKNYRIILPTNLEEKVIKILHKSIGLHQSVYKTTNRVLRDFYLPMPIASIQKVLVNCLHCARKGKSPASKIKTHKQYMKSYQAKKPMESLFVDFFWTDQSARWRKKGYFGSER